MCGTNNYSLLPQYRGGGGGGGGVTPTHAVQRVNNRLLKYMDGKARN